MSSLTSAELRRQNLSALLRYVHEHGPTSRAVLTAHMGVNRSTVGGLTADLVRAGLVSEEAPALHPAAGRPSLIVVPRASAVYALAFEIGVDYISAARVGLGGVVLDRRDLYRPRGDYALGDVVAHLHRFAGSLLVGLDVGGCVGIGAAVPGVVRCGDGLVRFAPNLGWVDAPLGSILHAHLRDYFGVQAPVQVANDADLAVLAERTRGAAAGFDDVVYVVGEVGVGAGIVVDGEPLHGYGGYGGEVGHMIVNPAGRLCRCGSRGCWETEIGEPAILAASGIASGRRDSVAEIVAASLHGDEAAARAMRHIGGWIALGVGNVVNIFNPRVVIFGGLLREIFPAIAEQLGESLHSEGLSAPRAQVRLVTPGLGGDSTLIGAAELAFAPLLQDPLAFGQAGSGGGAAPGGVAGVGGGAAPGGVAGVGGGAGAAFR